jgi:hypothetical protein
MQSADQHHIDLLDTGGSLEKCVALIRARDKAVAMACAKIVRLDCRCGRCDPCELAKMCVAEAERLGNGEA